MGGTQWDGTDLTERAVVLGLAPTLLLLADTRVRLGLDGDASVTFARAIGRVAELERLAPLIRFADTGAAHDRAAAQLLSMRLEIRRLAPLLARFGEAGDG